MEKEQKKFQNRYSLKEPIIELSIGGAIIIGWIILLIITGFYWGYLLILIVPLYFTIDGIFTYKRIMGYRKQKEERENKENNNNPL